MKLLLRLLRRRKGYRYPNGVPRVEAARLAVWDVEPFNRRVRADD